MVGHLVLVQGIEVRILVGQQKILAISSNINRFESKIGYTFSMDRLSKPFNSVLDLISFQDLVKEYFLKKGYKEIQIDDQGFIELNGSHENRYGIWNVAQVCSQSSVEEWGEIINGHFEKIFQIPTEASEYLLKKDDFNKIKNDLRLQVYPHDYLDHIGFRKEEVVYKSDIPGTVSVVVIDLPSTLQALTWPDAKMWGLEEKEIFAIALANTLEYLKRSNDSREGILDTESKIHYLEGSDLLTAVQILNSEWVNTFSGTYGALISIPTRHLVLCYPVNDLGVVKATQTLGSITSQINNAGPGSLSPLLYWYYNKNFVVLPYSIIDNKFNFMPPPEFITVLNSLG